ncbi:PREDICTED: uncharacterized protein LOC109236047 [Nicotiana attenuata]|uniref:uncharacterized protein LOC109236047 n=1 Tax=Nicotiana attenuata TaxID=49451 RepID=UPI0009055834|nr:PREDICTED: uncharacterized protein LOC109236047 [Nicotiana attenuata]
MVISWLTTPLSREIAESVQYSESVVCIWEQLETIYDTVNGNKIFDIKKELASTCQVSLDIASYFNKLKRLWDELAFMRKHSVNPCNCPLQRELEEDKLYQFLMGLNEIYVSVRSNLLMRQPLPSLDIAYNILLQDESQRHISSTPQFNSDSASFNATFTKGRRVAANATAEPEFTAVGHNADGSSHSGSYGSSEQSSTIHVLSMEQYNQLLTLLQQSHVSDTSPQSNLMASANFAGTLLSGDLLNVASSSS